MRSTAKPLLLCLALLTCGSAPAADYAPQGECAGLPRLQLEVPEGFCVGLVASGFAYPRGIVALPSGDLLITDMTGWIENRGRVILLRRQGGKFVARTLLRRLDRPHGLAIGPDGKVYIGEVGRIFRSASTILTGERRSSAARRA